MTKVAWRHCFMSGNVWLMFNTCFNRSFENWFGCHAAVFHQPSSIYNDQCVGRVGAIAEICP
jgi:hypothetical protein|tara:strand:- start:4501 stop:4686 length:186 start_codon:yes stop_codon:yes gene_type:complete